MGGEGRRRDEGVVVRSQSSRGNTRTNTFITRYATHTSLVPNAVLASAPLPGRPSPTHPPTQDPRATDATDDLKRPRTPSFSWENARSQVVHGRAV